MSENIEGFGTLLVPLDGSSLAEQALPAARQLALATRSSVLLARVTPGFTWAAAMASEGALATPEVYQRIVDDEERQAQEYLAQQAVAPRTQHIEVRTVVACGEPASCLLDLVSQESVGLVIMTTHGRTGLARFALGSVADRLVRGGRVPVLLLRSFGKACTVEQMQRAVVPLDGSARAEQALALARQLAGRVLREVVALRVVDAEATPNDVSEAKRYLEEVLARECPTFATYGCRLTMELQAGDTAQQIVQQAEADCQLVIMATHGRTGAARWALGSVADRVLQAAAAPLLLVRAL